MQNQFSHIPGTQDNIIMDILSSKIKMNKYWFTSINCTKSGAVNLTGLIAKQNAKQAVCSHSRQLLYQYQILTFVNFWIVRSPINTTLLMKLHRCTSIKSFILNIIKTYLCMSSKYTKFNLYLASI